MALGPPNPLCEAPVRLGFDDRAGRPTSSLDACSLSHMLALVLTDGQSGRYAIGRLGRSLASPHCRLTSPALAAIALPLCNPARFVMHFSPQVLSPPNTLHTEKRLGKPLLYR